MQDIDHTQVVSPKEQRFPELDAVRGLAAFSVVLLHFHDMWLQKLPPASNALQTALYLALRPFYNGGAAVLLFFVLSGFVLSLPLLRGKRQPYRVYALRRILRIYGPYLGALVLALIGNTLLYARVHPPGWSQAFWNAPVQLPSVMQHVFFLGIYDVNRYDFVIWTLVYEMRISLVFPLLFMLVQTTGWTCIVGMFTVAAAFPWLTGSEASHPLRVQAALTLYYCIFFVAGILLASHLNQITAWWQRASRTTRVVIALASACLYSYPTHLALTIARALPRQTLPDTLVGDLRSCITLLGVAGLLVVSLQARHVSKLLRSRPLHFLGRISYSLYLLHPIVLLSISLLLYRRLSLWLQLPLYIVSALFAGWLFCIAVEEPCIRWSRRAGNLARRPTV